MFEQPEETEKIEQKLNFESSASANSATSATKSVQNIRDFLIRASGDSVETTIYAAHVPLINLSDNSDCPIVSNNHGFYSKIVTVS